MLHRMEQGAEQAAMRAELEHYKALECERNKWEEREGEFLERLQEVEKAALHRRDEGSSSESGKSASQWSGEESATSVHSEAAEGESGEGATARLPTREKQATVVSAISMALQHLPLGKFSGEGTEDSETFEEWVEQLELLASAGEWDGKTKLVNLTTWLLGQAYAFYRLCTAQKRGDYDTLKELLRRFTPVRLQSVQSSLFHEKKQKAQETVDAYAQDVRKLFVKTYPPAKRANPETEEMDHAVLACQFVAGLRPVIRKEIARTEGSFDQLLVKARHEEAKLRDFAEEPDRVMGNERPPRVSGCQERMWGLDQDSNVFTARGLDISLETVR